MRYLGYNPASWGDNQLREIDLQPIADLMPSGDRGSVEVVIPLTAEESTELLSVLDVWRADAESWEDLPRCPHCGHENYGHDLLPRANPWVVACEECDRLFSVRVKMVYQFQSFDKE